MSSPESLTLREQLNAAERLNREIMDHLERAFVPQAHELRRVTRISGEDDPGHQIGDIALRSQVDGLLKGDAYTLEMLEKLQKFLTSIGREVGKIVAGN